MVVLGVLLERYQGTNVDDITDQIRVHLAAGIAYRGPRSWALDVDALASRLKPFAGQNFRVRALPPFKPDLNISREDVAEDGFLADSLIDAFLKAHWVNLQPDPNPHSLVEDPHEANAWGVGVSVNPRAPDKNKEAARALASELQIEHIAGTYPEYVASVMACGPGEAEPITAIIVCVGRHP
jgi:hypothetical protein